MNPNGFTEPVIPGLARNPEVHHRIPVFAGMTRLSAAFNRLTARHQKRKFPAPKIPISPITIK